MKKIYVSKSLEETKSIAKTFVEKLLIMGGKSSGKAVVILLQGNLGSGKTTFVRAVGEVLRVQGNITSPTFVLEKVYKIKGNENFSQMVHIDAYRLSGENDMNALGWGEVVDNPKNIVFVEWPEVVSDVFPEDTPKIFLEFIDENTRTLTPDENWE